MSISIAQRHLPINAKLQGGKYRITNILGQGGFGITYLAEHQTFGEVAIKELFISSGDSYCSRENTTQRNVIAHFDLAQFENFKSRFLEEARTLYKLRDVKGVVKVQDIFDENGTVYFSMEFLDGDKLEDYVKKRQKLSEKDGIPILRALAHTLSEIHRRGVLHRDIKPGNIIIKKTGEPFLIDFGIARGYAESESQGTHTTFHSPRYSPPEQKIAKARMGTYSDVYSLGATAYYMFTGMHPQSLEERLAEEYQSPKHFAAQLSDKLDDLITRSLTIRDKDRIQNADEFLSLLKGISVYRDKQETEERSMPTVTPYIPSTHEAVRIQQPQPPVSDDATVIKSFEPTPPPNIPQQNPSVRHSPPNNPVKDDDATAIIRTGSLSPMPPAEIPNDEKTVLEPLNKPEEDPNKTLILEKNPPKKKIKRDLFAWLKTRDGRIIGSSIAATTVGAIGIGLFLSSPEKKSAPPVVPTVVAPPPVNTDSINNVNRLLIAKQDSAARAALEKARQDSVDKATQASTKKSEMLKKVKAPKESIPAKTTEPTLISVTPPILQPKNVTVTETPPPPTRPVAVPSQNKTPIPPRSYLGHWKYNNTNLEIYTGGSCKFGGGEGTYRTNRSTPDFIEFTLYMNDQSYPMTYYRDGNYIELSDKHFTKQ